MSSSGSRILNFDLVVRPGGDAGGHGPGRAAHAQRQVDQEGTDLDLGAVAVRRARGLAGALVGLVLQLDLPEDELHPVDLQGVAPGVGVGLRRARARQRRRRPWPERVARLRLTWASPAGPLPASLQAVRNSATPMAEAAERAETECIVVLLMVWVRMDSGSPDLRGNPCAVLHSNLKILPRFDLRYCTEPILGDRWNDPLYPGTIRYNYNCALRRIVSDRGSHLVTAYRYAVRGLALLCLATTAGCARADRRCEGCETLVVAAVSEPSTLLPPLVSETVGRDIGDQVFERLADLRAGAASIDSAAYQPGLAARWERVDSLTWRFHLRPGARWHDGRPVTSGDVRFSFDAFSDSTIGAPAQSVLAGRVAIVPEDSATFLVRFTEPSPEQLYDATYHVRVIPAHVWSAIPRARWAGDTALAHLVGSGPYRVAQWQRGQFLTLAADSSFTPAPALRRAIWRFTTDPDAALNLVLSHEADVLEAAAGPDRERRAAADSSVRIIRYPSAAYGFLGFNLVSPGGHAAPHPVLGDRSTRRGLAMAVDRATAAKAVFGPAAKAPPGPMSQLLWLWSDSIATLPFDRDAAARELDAAGWRVGQGRRPGPERPAARASTFWCRARARRDGSSRPCSRRCGARPARP